MAGLHPAAAPSRSHGGSRDQTHRAQHHRLGGGLAEQRRVQEDDPELRHARAPDEQDRPRGKAQNTDVKRFAAFEITEQTTVAQVLTDKQNPPPAPLTDEQEAIGAALRKLPGAAFDRQYVKVQIDGHLMLRKIQRAYIAHPGKQDLLHIAKLADATIGEHLDYLSRLLGDL